jgi:hypothetical protein
LRQIRPSPAYFNAIGQLSPSRQVHGMTGNGSKTAIPAAGAMGQKIAKNRR